MRQNNSKRKLKTVTIASQNIRGLKSETRLQEMFSHILRFSILAACFQETWRTGTETLSIIAFCSCQVFQKINKAGEARRVLALPLARKESMHGEQEDASCITISELASLQYVSS